MCSNVDDGILVPEHQSTCDVKTCLKCDQPAVVIVRIKDGYCKDCFMSYSIHKFRMSFGKSKLIRDQERVILAFSGGNSSSAMLHLVQEGKSERAKKKLRFIPVLVYIDESSAFEETDTEYLKQTTEKMSTTGLEFSVYSLTQVFENDITPILSNNTTQEDIATDLDKNLKTCSLNGREHKSHIQDLLKSAKSLTAKQNLLVHLRLQLLSQVAQYHECTKVLLGETSTHLAIQMLSNITQGGGAHLSYQVGFADTRRENVTFVRPMREFSNKEVAMYNALNNVVSIVVPNLSTKKSSNSSLFRLTEEFVTGLQADFPMTVPTIFRTGEKLDVSDRADSKGGSCCMCQAPLDTDVGECSALSATVFSQKISNTKKTDTEQSESKKSSKDDHQSHESSQQTHRDVCVNKDTAKGSCDGQSSGVGSQSTECCGEGDGSCQSAKARLSLEDLQSALCYGCRLVVKDMEDYTTLPQYMLDSAAKHVRRSKMRESIEEFLLVDEG